MPNSVISKTKQQQQVDRRLVCEKAADEDSNLRSRSSRRKRRISSSSASPSSFIRANNIIITSATMARSTNYCDDDADTLVIRAARRGTGMLLAAILCAGLLLLAPVASSPSSLSSLDHFGAGAASESSGANQHHQLQQFDPSAFRSIHEAIRGHPDLREFASLCELDGVKEIVVMDKTPLTVFAPIDRSMLDLLSKSKSRSINLIELAKHHIVQGFVAPDESTKFPLKFSSYSSLSPLYLSTQGAAQRGAVYVNNAKLLATYLIPIDPDTDQYQTLHVIDQPLDFAYLSKRAQLRPSSAAASNSMSSQQQQQQRRTTQVKRAISLDDLLQTAAGGASGSELQQAATTGVHEYAQRFGDVHSSQAHADMMHARAYHSAHTQQRLQLARDELALERLGRFIREHAAHAQHVQLMQSNNTSGAQLNTYFLPVNSAELESLLAAAATSEQQSAALLRTLDAHVVPNQVLFTRVMGLGQSHASSAASVSLSLAKTLPSGEDPSAATTAQEPASAALLATPLLLQAVSARDQRDEEHSWRAGVTSAEIVLANIPLANGVLHLIKKPLLVTDSINLLDYLNDNDNQLSQVVGATGSRTAVTSGRTQTAAVGLKRFRELLARERQLLSTFSTDGQPPAAANRTILAPSDDAFARLRYDLRALVSGDESLVPRHWDASYRQALLERLVKRHVIPQQTITSDQVSEQQPLRVASDLGKLLSFTAGSGGELQVECDASRARVLHHDLIGANGVLHIIDRVLGEDEETVYSLLKSIVLRQRHLLDESSAASNELGQLIELKLRTGRDQVHEESQQVPNGIEQLQEQGVTLKSKQQQQSPELALISKAIGQYLDELLASRRQQLQMLANSVNISYQLAKLTSLAEGQDDWNERFKQTERQFTYFVPSDLAWIRLQQAQPELYKPLMYFLEQSAGADSHEAATAAGQQQQQQQVDAAGDSGIYPFGGATATSKSPRSSESSHRLRQILERHLVVNRKLAKKDLDQLDSLQTLGATLRLVEAPAQQQLTATFNDGSSIQPASAFAALHSIAGGGATTSSNNLELSQSSSSAKLKSLRLDSSSANIVQAREASNGFVYVIDNVLLLPDDSEYIMQTSQAPAVSSTMSSLLGAHNSAIIDFIQNLVSVPMSMSAQSILTLIGVLFVCISILLVTALFLLARRRRQNKLNRHQQLESGLTSSSSANSGSTSTTKSL